MCDTDMYVQLLSQKPSGPLPLCPSGRRNRGSHPRVEHSPTGIPQVPLQTHKHTGPGGCMRHIYYTFTLEHHLTQYFLPVFQFDLPFVEVHRVKAVRFSLPSSKEKEEYEEIGEPSSTISAAEIGRVESESRAGSRTCLTEKSSGREMTDKRKTPNSFLCGLCCTPPPAVSVWNCDGEILPDTEVFCRWVHSHNS